VKNVKSLGCTNCGSNAFVSVKHADVTFRAGTCLTSCGSVFDAADVVGGFFLTADVKVLSDRKIAENGFDLSASTADACNPERALYTPLAEDACDALSVSAPFPYKCWGGAGSCRQSCGVTRQTGKVCIKAGKQTKAALEVPLILQPDAAGVYVGTKQSQVLLTDCSGEVVGCLRVQWTLCLNGDCGGGSALGCGDSDVFTNPKCGRCLQSSDERIGTCADLFKFSQSPADTCEWRECCCDPDGTAGGAPCSTANTGGCSDSSCRRKKHD